MVKIPKIKTLPMSSHFLKVQWDFFLSRTVNNYVFKRKLFSELTSDIGKCPKYKMRIFTFMRFLVGFFFSL